MSRSALCRQRVRFSPVATPRSYRLACRLAFILIVGALGTLAGTSHAAKTEPFTVDFVPEENPSFPFQGLRVTVLPVVNNNDPFDHVRHPQRDPRPVEESGTSRVVGVTYNLGNKACKILVAQEPIESLLQTAIEEELAALGFEVVPPPVDTLSRGDNVLTLFDDKPADTLPDIALLGTIHAFYEDAGPFRKHIRKNVRFEIRPRMRLELFAVDVARKRILWSGLAQEEGAAPCYETPYKSGIQKLMDLAMERFLSQILRDNEELEAQLADPKKAPPD